MSQTTVDLPEHLSALLTIACARRSVSPADFIVETLRTTLEPDTTPLLADAVASLGTLAADIQRRASTVGLPLIPSINPCLVTGRSGPALSPWISVRLPVHTYALLTWFAEGGHVSLIEYTLDALRSAMTRCTVAHFRNRLATDESDPPASTQDLSLPRMAVLTLVDRDTDGGALDDAALAAITAQALVEEMASRESTFRDEVDCWVDDWSTFRGVAFRLPAGSDRARVKFRSGPDKPVVDVTLTGIGRDIRALLDRDATTIAKAVADLNEPDPEAP